MVNIDSGTQMTTFLEMGSVGGKATAQVPVIIGQMMTGARNGSYIGYVVSYIQDSVRHVFFHTSNI